MQPFTLLTAIAAPYDRLNVDTDQILPARFLFGCHQCKQRSCRSPMVIMITQKKCMMY